MCCSFQLFSLKSVTKYRLSTHTSHYLDYLMFSLFVHFLYQVRFLCMWRFSSRSVKMWPFSSAMFQECLGWNNFRLSDKCDRQFFLVAIYYSLEEQQNDKLIGFRFWYLAEMCEPCTSHCHWLPFGTHTFSRFADWDKLECVRPEVLLFHTTFIWLTT